MVKANYQQFFDVPVTSNMVLKLYGNVQSTCTRRVALVAKYANIPYDYIPVDLKKGEHKSPAFVEKQPFGQVPYLVSAKKACVLHLLTAKEGRR